MDFSAKNNPQNLNAKKTFCGFTLLLCMLPFVQRASSSEGALARPRDVVLTSVNLITSVSWKPGNGAPADQLYSVYYRGSYEKYYNESMLVKDGCNRTRKTSCNLTDVLSLWVHYDIVVCAWTPLDLVCADSEEISVLTDTQIEAPYIDLYVFGNNIKMEMSPPKLHEEDIKYLYSSVLYNVTLCVGLHEHQQQCEYYQSEVASLDFKNIKYNTEYCFTGQIIVEVDNRDKFSAVSQQVCRTTEKEKASKWVVFTTFLISVIVSFAVVFTLLLLGHKIFKMARYIFAVDMPLPKTLLGIPSKQNGTFLLISEKDVIKEVNICSTVEVMCDDVEDDYIVNGFGLQS
ncbi:interferon alpha/beta receptor 2-like isoform X2 [Petromyzon marinus]|nr:interleukin-20 receptor subunit alpha-like isoform X2 [Petromyzon marinus]XP_032828434.1 interleukin-20 receptor subunit alpha-like isoform X2 [Petromyzon marinus]XP_032828435.1 interleukin-20 receptor subunit alpha-like isoform X2 [Petromyzon marinus]XP_032828436.1 interleukin-20 receptor subunit alpha-like isoform X2 [Petromyzon marinus]XP_032828438.1 interleukin-20 receptor subunit alpha-like isoform X2 [Petromyzon marinus]XP_032828439.1 interleukin-20 receptor subunit alpha-like isoform